MARVWAYLGRAAVCLAAALVMIAALGGIGMGITWWVAQQPDPVGSYVAAAPDLGGSYGRQSAALGFQVCADLYDDVPPAELAGRYRTQGIRGTRLLEPEPDQLIAAAVNNLCPDAPAPGLLPG